jgi:thioredoxin reductase (NADPH)
MELFDVVVIGSGPGGLQAGIYTARAQLKTLILGTTQKKSMLMGVPFIGNYLGFPNGISGEELIRLGNEHAMQYGAEIRDEEVVLTRFLQEDEKTKIDSPLDERIKVPHQFFVKTPSHEFAARTIIIATGLGIIRAGIKGEATFENKGLSYCVVCDGYFFKDKTVAVIGHRDFAAQKVTELASYTDKVLLFTHGNKPDMSPGVLEDIESRGVKISTERVTEVFGDKLVKGLVLKNGDRVDVDGVFVGVGTASSLSFAKTLGLTVDGSFLKVDHRAGATNVEGVFAVGDCTGAPLQIAKVVGDGAVSSLASIEYLRGGVHVDHGTH